MTAQLVYPASKRKALLLLLGSAAFVALGLWLRKEHPFVGWSCIAFFGLGIPAALTMFLPSAVYLRLDEQGIEMASLFKKQWIGWNDVEAFELAQIQGTKMIAILYSSDYQEQKLLRKASAALAGMEGGIANNYSAPLQEILKSLREWHARYRRGA